MISDLIYKELIEEITPEESRVLKKWLEEPANRALYDRIRQKNGLGRRLYEYVDVDSLKDFRSTLPAPAPAAPRRSLRLRYALYAAALVPLLLTGCMLLMGVKDQMHKIEHSTLPEWVLLVVWSTGCILTLLIAPGWLNDYLAPLAAKAANTLLPIGYVALIVEMFRAQRIYLQTEEQ